MDYQFVASVLEAWGYVALLGALTLTGVGFPVPEDLLLLSAGYLVFAGVFQWPSALVVCGVGVVISDMLVFGLGRHLAARVGRPTCLGSWAVAGWLRRLVGRLVRQGNVAIIVARLIPGTRVPVFIGAGLRGVPTRTFVLYDVVGAALWVPMMLAVGHAGSELVAAAQALVRWVSAGAALGIVAVSLVASFRFVRARIQSDDAGARG